MAPLLVIFLFIHFLFVCLLESVWQWGQIKVHNTIKFQSISSKNEGKKERGNTVIVTVLISHRLIRIQINDNNINQKTKMNHLRKPPPLFYFYSHTTKTYTLHNKVNVKMPVSQLKNNINRYQNKRWLIEMIDLCLGSDREKLFFNWTVCMNRDQSSQAIFDLFASRRGPKRNVFKCAFLVEKKKIYCYNIQMHSLCIFNFRGSS